MRLTEQPTNTNFLEDQGFSFLLMRAPTVPYFGTNTAIPGLSAPPVMVGTPFVNLPFIPDHMDFEPLNIEFIVDAEMVNYMLIYNWMRQLTFPSDYDEYNELDFSRGSNAGPYSDGTLTILTPRNNPQVEVRFYNLFPSSLSSLPFTLQKQDVNPAKATVTFAYQNYEIVRLG